MAKLGSKTIEAFETIKRIQNICDVHIKLADGTTFGAHYTVLMLGSEWFRTRLNQNWDHSGSNSPIMCTDFAPMQTRSIIEFSYRNDIELSIENVQEVLQASDFYIITDETLFSNVETFCSLHVGVISMMITRDTFCIHEEKLFDILSNWLTSENRDVRATWYILVPYIRFGRMSAEFLIEKVVYKDVIDNDYAMKIMSYLTSLQVQRNTFPDHARSPQKCISLKDVELVRFFEQSPDTWTCDSLNGDRISFFCQCRH
ncbi:uncharacterized protein LOC125664780 [Ostrea edulis]|uniref:uncharacterized protein LOC125664780 n=1 Tax=Ostrea edulis TaxID=37623 RepID=UPI0024AF8CE5|nr:uncharacterized protein LOC125664780 [Ostrea edulis]